MRKFAERLFDVRPSEWGLAWALFGWYFLLTSLHNLLKPARNAFFLSTAGAANLPWAYIATAFVSAGASLAYGRWVAPLPRRRQILGTQAFVAGSLILFWLILQRPTAWTAGAFYAWLNVFTLFLVSQFFLLGNDLFDPRQAKRILGFVGAGGLAGGVVGGLAAGTLAKPLGSASLLWVATLLLVACGALAVYVMRIGEFRRTGRAVEPGDRGRRQGVSGGLAVLRRVTHLRRIAYLLFSAILVSTFVDWMFNAAVESAIPDQAAQTVFFGRVFALFNGGAFLLQIFLTSVLLRTLGLAGALLLLPLGMGLGVTAMIVAPGLWAASLAKGADMSLRNSIDQSAREILYLPVPSVLKARAKPFIDTVVTRGADGVAGVLILLGSGMAAFAGRGFTLLTAGLIGLWLVAVWGVRKSYRQALEKLLAVRDVDLEAAVETSVDSDAVRELLDSIQADADAEQTRFALDLLADLPSAALREPARRLLKHPDAPIRARAVDLLAAVATGEDADLARPLLDDPDTRVRGAAVRLLCGFEPDVWLPRAEELLDSDDPELLEAGMACLLIYGGEDRTDVAGRAIGRLVRSAGESGAPARLACARALGRLGEPHPLQRHLETLLADGRTDVVQAALEATARVPRRDLMAAVLPHLEARDTRSAARRALAASGEDGIPSLSAAMRDPDLSIEVRRWIPGALVGIGTRSAYRALLEALPSLEEGRHRLYVLKALNKMRRRHPSWEAVPDMVRSEIDRELSTAYDLERQEAGLDRLRLDMEVPGEPLEAYRGALSYRAESHLERAFRLQGLLYSPQTIYYAYAGLHASDSHRGAHALELLELALDRKDAGRMVPLFDPDLDPQRRANIGARWYDLEERDPIEDLESMLERGEPWLQAYAVGLAGTAFPERLAASLERLSATGSPLVRPLARRYVENGGGTDDMSLSPVEKAAALRHADILRDLGAEDLLQLAAVAEEREFEADEYLFYQGEEGDYLYVVLDGSIRIEIDGQEVDTYQPGQSIGTFAVLDRRPRSASAMAVVKSRTLALHRADMGQILADNFSLVEDLFQNLTGIIRDMNVRVYQSAQESGKAGESSSG